MPLRAMRSRPQALWIRHTATSPAPVRGGHEPDAVRAERGGLPPNGRDPQAPEQARPSPRTPGSVAASISNGLVSLHERYYGKGPTKAKAYLGQRQRD